MRWPFMRKPKRVIIATAANPLTHEVRKLRADVINLQTQEVCLRRDLAYANADIAYFRRRIEELLPWALVGASHVSRFESDDIGTAAPIGDKVYLLTNDKAAVFVERIEAGEFTESS